MHPAAKDYIQRRLCGGAPATALSVALLLHDQEWIDRMRSTTPVRDWDALERQRLRELGLDVED